MGSENVYIWEVVIIFGIALALLVAELISVQRARRRYGDKRRPPDSG